MKVYLSPFEQLYLECPFLWYEDYKTKNFYFPQTKCHAKKVHYNSHYSLEKIKPFSKVDLEVKKKIFTKQDVLFY